MSEKVLVDKLSNASNAVEKRLKKLLDPIARAQEAAKKAQEQGQEPPEPPKINAEEIKTEVVKVDSEEKGRAIWEYLQRFVYDRIKKIENKITSIENKISTVETNVRNLQAAVSRISNNILNVFNSLTNIQQQVDFNSSISPIAYGKIECDGSGGFTTNVTFGCTAAIISNDVRITFDETLPNNNYVAIVTSIDDNAQLIICANSNVYTTTHFDIEGRDTSSGSTGAAIDASTDSDFRFTFVVYAF